MNFTDIMYLCFDCTETFSDFGLEDLECPQCGSYNVGEIRDEDQEKFT